MLYLSYLSTVSRDYSVNSIKMYLNIYREHITKAKPILLSPANSNTKTDNYSYIDNWWEALWGQKSG